MTELKAIVFPAGAIICALAFLYKLLDLRSNRRDPALIALLAAFVCKGASFTLSTPAVSAALDSWTGIANLGALSIHLFGGVASSVGFLVALIYWVYPTERAWPKSRLVIGIAAALAVVMVVLWLIARSGQTGRSAHYLLQNAHRPIVAAYLLLYITAFGIGMASIIRLALRFARIVDSPWLRRGLWCSAAGAGFYFIYCANRAEIVIAVKLGLDPLDWEVVTPVTAGTGILLLAIGMTMPSWGPKLSSAHDWTRDYVAYQRLRPLWDDLYRTVPSIALDSPPSRVADRFLVRDLRHRLYRRVIEIRDGCLAIHHHPDDPVATRLQAAITATEATTDEDYEAEVARLVDLARTYATT